MTVEIRPIKTEDDYKIALQEIAGYFENEPEIGSTEGNRFEVLLTLVEVYETKQYPIDHSYFLIDPILICYPLII